MSRDIDINIYVCLVKDLVFNYLFWNVSKWEKIKNKKYMQLSHCELIKNTCNFRSVNYKLLQ